MMVIFERIEALLARPLPLRGFYQKTHYGPCWMGDAGTSISVKHLLAIPRVRRNDFAKSIGPLFHRNEPTGFGQSFKVIGYTIYLMMIAAQEACLDVFSLRRSGKIR
jgi:hypothetical protein